LRSEEEVERKLSSISAALTSSVTVMLTTAGRTVAASVATSGAPGSTDRETNGAALDWAELEVGEVGIHEDEEAFGAKDDAGSS
jgi:hypothetical protein